MAFDVRTIFLIGVGIYLFTHYYLEKQYEGKEIYWLYSLTALVLALLSAYTVITDHTSRQYYIPLTALSITMAILYYPSGGDGSDKAED